jgi:hypothetical protein
VALTKSAVAEAFSIQHAAILGNDGVSDHEFGDIYGIRSGSLELDQDSYDNTGDDAVLSTWFWANKVNVTIQAGYIPFQTLETIYGTKVLSSTSGGNLTTSFNFLEQNRMQPKPRPVRLRLPSKDAAGNEQVMDIILYKVQFQPFSFDGPAYKEGLLLNYNGTALMSDTDEKGQPVLDSVTSEPSKAVGRIITIQKAS